MEVIFTNKKYAVIEPRIENSTEAKLERVWGSFSGCYSIRNTKITMFDPYAAMSIQPVQYILSPFSIDDTMPSEDWIDKNLESFIREENYTERYRNDKSSAFFPVVEKTIEIQDEFLQEFLNQSEWEKSTQLELPKDDSIESMADCIYKVLCKPQIGSTKNLQNVDKNTFCQQLIPLLKSRQRLLFVLPGCPFKDQNRFRVPFSASNADFSEISFLIRLHNMVQALYQMHPYGGQVIVLSDGRLYQDIFKITNTDVEEYRWRLIDYRNKLNIRGDINIIDIKDMIERANSNGVISRILHYIEDIITRKHCNTRCFENLIYGMKWNINSRLLLSDLSDSDAWAIMNCNPEEVPSRLLSRWKEYNDIAVEAAISYASTNLMLKWTDLIKKFFPDSIRCTVHPKKDQFTLSQSYAWNGIAWSQKWPSSIKDIQTIPYYKLQEFQKINKVVFRSTGLPCFFTQASNHTTFDCAKEVLNSDGWNYNDIFGRMFTIYDLPAFINLGKDDPNFTWARKKVSEEYYTTLLDFRLNHYKKYGFGVHALFQNNNLIGQLGIQVLDENSQQIEFVIFLGKKYVNKGLGTKLLGYLFERCRTAGIKKIYGVTRTENDPAQKLIRKYGGVAIKSVTHYEYPGILYELNL